VEFRSRSIFGQAVHQFVCLLCHAFDFWPFRPRPQRPVAIAHITVVIVFLIVDLTGLFNLPVMPPGDLNAGSEVLEPNLS
jgi:hypothetical protein